MTDVEPRDDRNEELQKALRAVSAMAGCFADEDGGDLRYQLSNLKAEVDDLKRQLRTEVRTQRLVVTDPATGADVFVVKVSDDESTVVRVQDPSGSHSIVHLEAEHDRSTIMLGAAGNIGAQLWATRQTYTTSKGDLLLDGVDR